MTMTNQDRARERLIFKCIIFYDKFYFNGRSIGIDFNCEGKPDMDLINSVATLQLKMFKSDHPHYGLDKFKNNPIREDEINALIQKPLRYFLQFQE